MTDTNKKQQRPKWFSYVRDIAIGGAIIIAIMAWQSKDMLSTDGSVRIEQQKLITLGGEVKPMLSSSKPNLVYFFAPWCQICDLSMSNLNYLDESKVNVVIIALDYQSIEEVQNMVADKDLQAPVFMGNHALKQAFNIKGYPSYYLIDQSGVVTSKSYGYSTAVGLKLREVFGA